MKTEDIDNFCDMIQLETLLFAARVYRIGRSYFGRRISGFMVSYDHTGLNDDDMWPIACTERTER